MDMSEENKKEENKIVHIDQKRFKNLAKKSYFAILEEYDCLRVKFINSDIDNSMEIKDKIRFITLCKYLIENGHSEALRLSCKFMYERYLKGL